MGSPKERGEEMKKVFVIASAVALLSLTSSASSDATISYGGEYGINVSCNYIQIHQKGVGEIKFTSGETEKDSKLEIIQKDEGIDVDVVYKKGINTLTIKRNKKNLIVAKFTNRTDSNSVSVAIQGGSINVTCGK